MLPVVICIANMGFVSFFAYFYHFVVDSIENLSYVSYGADMFIYIPCGDPEALPMLHN